MRVFIALSAVLKRLFIAPSVLIKQQLPVLRHLRLLLRPLRLLLRPMNLLRLRPLTLLRPLLRLLPLLRPLRLLHRLLLLVHPQRLASRLPASFLFLLPV